MPEPVLRLTLDDHIDDFNPRAFEEDREQRWAIFVADVKAQSATFCGYWPFVVESVADALRPSFTPHPCSFEQRCRDFSETDGWSGVMAVISRAMREKGL